ncbi:MAG TPA: T9SS type A sorting domain-containing protein [Bacteroidia bacterium]|nr:T9SS type A sorting domain-containing protein [Bacteroidia bacterium]
MKLRIILSLAVVIFCSAANAQTGITWSPPQPVSSSGFGNNHPRITIDRAGNPMVVWGKSSNHSVNFSKWNGSSFTSPIQINPSGTEVATDTWMGLQIASFGDTVYVVYKEYPEAPDSAHIYCVRSYNGGTSFSAPVRVSYIADSICRFPTVTTNMIGCPVVGFMKFDANFGNARWVVSTSSDFGLSFSPDVLASGWSGPGALVCDCCPGTVTASDNTVAMIYRDNLNNLRDSWAGISTDSGQSFNEGINIDQNNWIINSCPSSGPDGVIIGDSLYSVFMNGAGGTAAVYFSAAPLNPPSNTTSWQLNGNTPGLVNQNYPRIDHFNNAVAVVWKQVVGSADQCVLRFSPDITIGLPVSYDTVKLGNITNVDVAVSGSNVYVVWQDNNTGNVNFRSGTYTAINTSLQPIDAFSISLTPNPVNNGMVSFSLNHELIHPVVELFDVTGKQHLPDEVIVKGNKITFNTDNVPTGIYFISVKDEQGNYTGKLIRL